MAGMFGTGFRERSTPEDIKSLRGTRTWRPGDNGLVGQWNGVWELDRVNTAFCFRCPGVQMTCDCGFYSYYAKDVSELELHYPVSVVGVIEGFGQTTIGPKGFRCSKAKILALCPVLVRNHPSYLFQISKLYGWYGKAYIETVPLELMEEGEPPPTPRLVEFFEKAVAGSSVPMFKTVSDMIAEFPPSENPYDQLHQPS